MHDTIRIKQVEFHDEASRSLLSMLNRFSNTAATVNRNGDENVFQLLKSQYSHSFRQLLEKYAATLINSCETRETQASLTASLTEKINYFVLEFSRKADEY